jgi:hypothetical protein
MHPGTAVPTIGCSRYGTHNPIPAVCGRMPPPGPRGQERGAPQTLGGNGAGLGESRQGGRSVELSFAIRRALICRGERMFSPRRGAVPGAATPAPSAATRPAPSGLGPCSPSPNSVWRNADSRPLAPSGPHANLGQRTKRPACSGSPGRRLANSWTTLCESPSEQTAAAAGC